MNALILITENWFPNYYRLGIFKTHYHGLKYLILSAHTVFNNSISISKHFQKNEPFNNNDDSSRK